MDDRNSLMAAEVCDVPAGGRIRLRAVVGEEEGDWVTLDLRNDELLIQQELQAPEGRR